MQTLTHAKWARRALGMLFLLTGVCVSTNQARAQENYEIQVYPYETVTPGKWMVEFHSNFTFSGRKTISNGVLPTQHAFHETLEVTHGFTPWFETGFYVFTAIVPDHGWQFVGTHLRPRVRVPEEWKWPVGVSLSTEFGYQRPNFSEDTWSIELRPIVDKQIGKWYLAFNPTFGKSLKGLNQKSGFDFEPNFKVGYELTRKVSAGIEYYGATGPFPHFDPVRDQEHQIFAAFDLDVSPKWEINLGFGVGVTAATDHFLLKTIIGYRFDHFPLSRHRSK